MFDVEFWSQLYEDYNPVNIYGDGWTAGYEYGGRRGNGLGNGALEYRANCSGFTGDGGFHLRLEHRRDPFGNG